MIEMGLIVGNGPHIPLGFMHPVLIETFVRTPRSTGGVDKASGWLHVGTAKGHGRYGRENQCDKPNTGHLASPPSERIGSELSIGTISPPSRPHRTLAGGATR